MELADGGNSQVTQWLGRCAFTAEGLDGTKILQAAKAWPKNKKGLVDGILQRKKYAFLFAFSFPC